jgi:hypothetical protein
LRRLNLYLPIHATALRQAVGRCRKVACKERCQALRLDQLSSVMLSIRPAPTAT